MSDLEHVSTEYEGTTAHLVYCDQETGRKWRVTVADAFTDDRASERFANCKKVVFSRPSEGPVEYGCEVHGYWWPCDEERP